MGSVFFTPQGTISAGRADEAAGEVPGILVSSLPLVLADPGLADIPVTVLRYYGLEPPPAMAGLSVW